MQLACTTYHLNSSWQFSFFFFFFGNSLTVHSSGGKRESQRLMSGVIKGDLVGCCSGYKVEFISFFVAQGFLFLSLSFFLNLKIYNCLAALSLPVVLEQ